MSSCPNTCHELNNNENRNDQSNKHDQNIIRGPVEQRQTR